METDTGRKTICLAFIPSVMLFTWSNALALPPAKSNLNWGNHRLTARGASYATNDKHLHSLRITYGQAGGLANPMQDFGVPEEGVKHLPDVEAAVTGMESSLGGRHPKARDALPRQNLVCWCPVLFEDEQTSKFMLPSS